MATWSSGARQHKVEMVRSSNGSKKGKSLGLWLTGGGGAPAREKRQTRAPTAAQWSTAGWRRAKPRQLGPGEDASCGRQGRLVVGAAWRRGSRGRSGDHSEVEVEQAERQNGGSARATSVRWLMGKGASRLAVRLHFELGAVRLQVVGGGRVGVRHGETEVRVARRGRGSGRGELVGRRCAAWLSSCG